MAVQITATLFVLGTTIWCAEAIPTIYEVTSNVTELSTGKISLQDFKASRDCKNAGVFCTSCSQLALCVDSSSGFLEFVLEECNTVVGEYCSTSLKKCHNKKSECSLNWKFECRETGTFPDPFDCNKYYTCELYQGRLIQNNVLCPVGTAYNAETSTCDLRDTEPICEGYPVPECPSTGVTAGPLPQNATVYYVCEDGLPQLFRCLEGNDYVFDTTVNACIHKDNQTTTTTTTTEPPTATEPPTTTTTEGPPAEPGDCDPGVYYPILYACKTSYYCESGRQYLSECASENVYFDRDARECRMGVCPYDEDWRLVCPTKVNRAIPGTCTLYYNCSASSAAELRAFRECDGYFDRLTLTCRAGECPYTDL